MVRRNMKKILLYVLSFLFIGCSVVGGAVIINNASIFSSVEEVEKNAPTNTDFWTDAGNYADSFAGGTGSSSNPYQIATAEQLARLAFLINDSSTNSTYKSLNYDVTNDIDLSLHYWKPVGTGSSTFSGNFNGNNHIFSGIFTDVESGFQGLFGYLSNAQIHDLSIEDSEIVGEYYVGSVAGYASDTTIYNCHNSSPIAGVNYGSSNDSYYGSGGGIVGYLYGSSSKVYNCSNSGTLDGKSSGGIVGYASSDAQIYDCFNEGERNEDNYIYVGGIAYKINSAEIYNCYNSARINGYGAGIVSEVINGSVHDCYNTGTIANQSRFGGGIANIVDGDSLSLAGSNIYNCYNVANVFGGGIVATLNCGSVYRCYNSGYIFANGSLDCGGIVARSNGDIGFSVSNCYNTGIITQMGVGHVGGIIGCGRYGTVRLSYNIGEVINYVTSSSSILGRTGGIIGDSYGCDIINCFVLSNISTRYLEPGAIAGYHMDTVSGTSYCIRNCYWGGNCLLENATPYTIIENVLNCGSCTFEDAKTLSWFTQGNWYSSYKWDFTLTWQIDSDINQGYPTLKFTQAIKPDDSEPVNASIFWTDTGIYADSFAGGDGTESNPYLISTSAQLARLAYLINNSSTNEDYKNLYYKQTTNLDMSAYWWKPIGTSRYYFSGNFDGGGFTISGLYTQPGTTSDYNYQGLFGYVEGISSSVYAEVHDVGIIDSNIRGYKYVGAIIGYISYYGNIYNCYNESSVSGYENIGGMVGYSSRYSSYENCYNEGVIVGERNNVGGIAGNTSGCEIYNCYNVGKVVGGDNVSGIVGETSATIYNCYNLGEISCNNAAGGIVGLANEGTSIFDCYNVGKISGGNYIGGLLGNCSIIGQGLKIYNSYNDGVVVGVLDYVGGIAGRLGGYNTSNVSSIYNCYNVAEVISQGGRYVGGIVGQMSWYSSIYLCYNKGNVSGYDIVGGILGGIHLSSNTEVVNNFNVGAVTASGSYIGGVIGSSSRDYNYCGGNCTVGVNDANIMRNAKTLSWYQDSSKWSPDYTWDFDTIWMFAEGMNDGFPILRGFLIEVTYYSNFGNNDTQSVYFNRGDSITIEDTNLFTRTGYHIKSWNTMANGGGLTYMPGDVYQGSNGLTLYAQWEAEIYTITLNKNGGIGGTSTIYLKYESGYYLNSSATGNAITSITSLPTKDGYNFNGYYSNATGGTRIVDASGNIVANNTYTSSNCVIYAQWVARNPAYYDEEGGYWYIENGKMPQKKVTDSTLISNINSSTTVGTTYYFAGLSLQSKVYSGKEYCQYNGNWYEVMPIRWRLVYSSSQTSGYGTTTDTLAVMAEIVYVDAFSDSYIGEGAGYSSESVTELIKNQIDSSYLVTESKSMPTFGSTSLNGTPASVSSNIFVASYDDLSNFTTNKNGTEKLGKIKFSDLAKDYLRANGKDTLYYTRDLGKTYNHIYCMNANGDRVQYKAQNYFGVQFTVKISEYACI